MLVVVILVQEGGKWFHIFYYSFLNEWNYSPFSLPLHFSHSFMYENIFLWSGLSLQIVFLLPPLSKISFIIYVPDIIFSLDILVVREVSESVVENKWNGSKVYPLLLPTKRRPEQARRGKNKKWRGRRGMKRNEDGNEGMKQKMKYEKVCNQMCACKKKVLTSFHSWQWEQFSCLYSRESTFYRSRT